MALLTITVYPSNSNLGLSLMSNVIKLRKDRLRRNAGSIFFVTFSKKDLTNRQKCVAFLLSTDNKKALVIRGVPTRNYKEAYEMLDRINLVKRKMEESLAQLCDVSWMFSKQPGKDFTRERKRVSLIKKTAHFLRGRIYPSVFVRCFLRFQPVCFQFCRKKRGCLN